MRGSMASGKETFQSLRPAGEIASEGAAARERFEGTRTSAELHALAPRGVGEILDTALDVLRARFLACVLLIAPLWLLPSALQRVGREASDPGELLTLFVGLALHLGVQTLGIALVTEIVHGELQGVRVPARRAVLVGLRRAPALLALTIVSQIAVAAGTLCCVVPGILLAWLWSVAPCALVLERIGPMRALSRSAALVRGSFWRWLGLIAVQTGLLIPLTALPTVLAIPDVESWVRARSGLSPAAFSVLEVLLTSAFTGVATAVAAVILTVFYLDLRVRSEGFDLAMRLERLRARFASRPTGLAEGAP